MVQVINTGNPQGKLSEMLGMSLGQGLGNGVNTFFANRSLESVMKDKSLTNAPQSQKLEALRSALSPYGEKGQEIFQQRMQIEQQEMNEKQAKLDQKQVLEKEKRLFQHQKDLQAQKDVAAKERTGLKPPPGGISGQPIPPEQIQAIENYIKQNPEASSDDLAIGLGKAGVNPAYSNPYIENRRRQEENSTKTQATENKIANANDIRFHEESKEYSDKVRKEAKTAKERIETINPIIKDVKEGKIKPTSAANIFRYFGKTGEKIADAVLSGKEANLLAAVPEFLEGRKDLFGVRLSDADLKLLQDKLPDIGKSPDANLTILNLMKKYAEKSILRSEAAENVLQEKGISTRSGKLRPLNYENLVEKEFDKIESEEENGVLMKLPDGREVPIQRSKIKEAEQLGATRVKR